jgi:hypothetical protein
MAPYIFAKIMPKNLLVLNRAIPNSEILAPLWDFLRFLFGAT